MTEDTVILCRMNAAMLRVYAMQAEMQVAIARGELPPDYSPDIRWEASAIEEMWRN